MRELTPEEVNAVSGGLSLPSLGGVVGEVESLVGSLLGTVTGVLAGLPLVGSLLGGLGL